MTALDLYQRKFKISNYGKVRFAPISALNASGLAYALENNSGLRNDKVEMLKRVNEGLHDNFWVGIDSFDVVTGNYGRYLKNKKSRAFIGTRWLKQPAVITWSKLDNYPLILIAFKGTNMYKHADRLSDEKAFAKKLCNLGDVHAGFYDIADSCKDALSEKLRIACQYLNVEKEGVQIILTGHSMGAAVASVTSINLLKSLAKSSNTGLSYTNGKNNIAVINFGQPKVWKKDTICKFKDILREENLIRLVTADKNGKKDPIAGYLKKGSLNFDHFGKEFVLIDKDLEVITTLVGGPLAIHPFTTYKKVALTEYITK